LVELSNFAGDGTLVTSRRFHVAWAALCSPALRPTRGSGRGAVVDMSGAGEVLDALVPLLPREAQAATESAVTTPRRLRNDLMANPYLGLVVAGTGNILSASMRCIRSISVV